MTAPAENHVQRMMKITAHDLQMAAKACRNEATRAEAEAKDQRDPSVALGIKTAAIGWRQLAGKFEFASRSAPLF